MDEKDTPSNVVPIRRGPGDIQARFRLGKNAFFEHILGKEQGINEVTGESSYDDDYEPEDTSHLVANDMGFGVKKAGPNTTADVLNGLAGKGRLANLMVGADESNNNVISMGKFKEERDMKRMMKQDE